MVDWYSCQVLSWRLSISLTADFCLEAVEEALAKHGKPAIFNTDQGSQFTLSDFLSLMLAYRIKLTVPFFRVGS